MFEKYLSQGRVGAGVRHVEGPQLPPAHDGLTVFQGQFPGAPQETGAQ